MIPEEVDERVRKKFLCVLTDTGAWRDEALDPKRVIWALKSEASKCDTWIKALKSKKAAWAEDLNGWRKCHTENYWAYYALIESI